jgi:serine O-acetyltransferase
VKRIDRAAGWLLDQVDRWRGVVVYPLQWVYRLTDRQEVIDADARRWAEVLWLEDRSRMLGRLLYTFPEFRSVYYHRLAGGNPAGALAGRVAARIWKGVPGIDFGSTEIGPGMFVSHGQATVLSAEHIGANLQVHQGVTVGWDYRSDRRPIIGDDVFIGAGAKILGAVTVGDGAVIGANAVVLCDVPAGATAVGVPARVKLPAPC